MEYIHVNNLEKFHPGYKDRTLQWAKIYFRMVQGDPDCELIKDEIDWARLLKMILLELEAQKPLPNVDEYWRKKGFNLRKRSMSLTVKVLHNFISIVPGSVEMPTDPRHVEEDKEEEKSKKGFIPPTLLEIQKYAKEKGHSLNEQKFLEWYTESGWRDNKGKKVKNWKLKVISWSSNERETVSGQKQGNLHSRPDSFAEQESDIGESI